MNGAWDPVRVKSHLRLTVQRLGQLQDKKDSLAKITKRDIATLLQQGNVALARLKTQNLMKEDAVTDLLEIIEMYCGVVIERFSELEKDVRPSPPLIEACSTIIHAAAKTESKDLLMARDMIAKRLGSDFARTARSNSDRQVSRKVLKLLSPPVSAVGVDNYLLQIAQAFSVPWRPEMTAHEKLNIISEVLDTSNSVEMVDLDKLRLASKSGIPDNPPWLRPRIWRLLLATLPATKAQWSAEAAKSRQSYYDLFKRLLEPIDKAPPPTDPLSPTDTLLTTVFDSLSRLPREIYAMLEEEPEGMENCPLSDHPTGVEKIACAGLLDARLHTVQERTLPEKELSNAMPTPEIRLDDSEITLSIEADTSGASDDKSSRSRSSTPAVLHPSGSFKSIGAHPQHATALIRMLFLHNSLHPPSSHARNVASLLVPLYSVMVQEVEPAEVAHAEADAFWMFQALVGEVGEIVDDEGINVWMRKLSEHLLWADSELYADLEGKGLDPALPHYSYRWLAPMLTHTLPLPSVLTVWDSLLAQPSNTRDNNPKLEQLINVCTCMLLQAKDRLSRLGHEQHHASKNLWGDETVPSPVDSGDVFMEGLTLLQLYAVKDAGGIDLIVQEALDLGAQYKTEQNAAANAPNPAQFGTMLKDTVWRGLAAVSSSEGETTDGESTDTSHSRSPPQPGAASALGGWASKFGDTVWKGITNQSAMEASPSPPSGSPSPSPQLKPKEVASGNENSNSNGATDAAASAVSGLWNYAGKLRDSDMAAKLSKAGSNITAKAFAAWKAPTSKPSDDLPSSSSSKTIVGRPSFSNHTNHASYAADGLRALDDQGRRGSLPNLYNINNTQSFDEFNSRPPVFRPPRESWMPQPRRPPMHNQLPQSPETVSSVISPTDSISNTSTSKQHEKTFSPAAAWTGLVAPKPRSASKSGPRPLLLNSQKLMTPTPRNHIITRSANNTPTPGWTDNLRRSLQGSRRTDSMSTTSSYYDVGPAELVKQRPRRASSRHEWDSDTSVSRVVPLNRNRISPKAVVFRTGRDRHSSVSSASSSVRSPPAPVSPSSIIDSFTLDEDRPAQGAGRRGWEQLDMPDSPATLPSPPPPRTPLTASSSGNVQVSNGERQRGSVVLTDSGVSVLDPPAGHPRAVKKVAPLPPVPILVHQEDTSDSPAPRRIGLPSSVKLPPRLKTKRSNPRPAELRIPQLSISSEAMPGRGLSPTLALPEKDFDVDAITPKASNFPSTSPTGAKTIRRSRKHSNGSARRNSHESPTHTRPRKQSMEHRRTESSAVEGDDEGYDDLLSAYESEDSRWSEPQ